MAQKDRPDPAHWRDAPHREDYEQHLEYRRVVAWPDGHRTYSGPMSREDAMAGFDWATSYGPIAQAGATVTVESRFVDAWEAEESRSFAKPGQAPAVKPPPAKQERMFT